MGANAQTSVPAFTAGQVLTAQQQTEINTGIPVFATTTTRDAAFGGTGEKTLAEGQFAYIEASNTTQYYDGAAWQTLVVGGLTLVKTQTVGSGVTTVNVTSAFSSTYDNYKIIFSGGVGSTVQLITMKLGSTTTGYYWAYVESGFGGGTGGSNQSNDSQFGRIGYSTTATNFMNVDVLSPNLAKNTVISYNWVKTETTGSAGQGGGFLNNTTQYTDFTLGVQGAGTFTGGTIFVYGYANS